MAASSVLGAYSMKIVIVVDSLWWAFSEIATQTARPLPKDHCVNLAKWSCSDDRVPAQDSFSRTAST
jgi:hypothetical protein